MLARSGVPYTSVRPVYIYGPLNYNPVEEWFFHRLAAGRPIPVPGSGMQVRRMHEWLVGAEWVGGWQYRHECTQLINRVLDVWFHRCAACITVIETVA
jgi:hypothetical protein